MWSGCQVLFKIVQRNTFGRENTLILLFWQQCLIFRNYNLLKLFRTLYRENCCSTFIIIMLPKAWKQCLVEMAVSQRWHMCHMPLSLAGIVYPHYKSPFLGKVLFFFWGGELLKFSGKTFNFFRWYLYPCIIWDFWVF